MYAIRSTQFHQSAFVPATQRGISGSQLQSIQPKGSGEQDVYFGKGGGGKAVFVAAAVLATGIWWNDTHPHSTTAPPPSASAPANAHLNVNHVGKSHWDDVIQYFKHQDNGAGGKWTHAQAAGIVANLIRESGITANQPGDKGKAYGVAQWWFDRRSHDTAYPIANHLVHTDIHQATVLEELGFVNWELTHTERGAGAALRETKTAYDAGYVCSRQYERPFTKEGDKIAEAKKRGKLAEQIA